MSRERFKSINFKPQALATIETANKIITNYAKQGFSLTLRQLYYQFVSKALIPNTERSYKNLGNVISDGRLAGLIDWDAIEDRTRNLKDRSHWGSPAQIVDACVASYFKHQWSNQEYRIEVWVEKEALSGIADKACVPLDVPYFCCKGYTSQSEMYGAAQRLISYDDDGQKPIIIHLGDHDPSGIDMSRDIQDRLTLFTRGDFDFEFHRIALNMDQIEEYTPPPNPAKVTDSRAASYIERFGDESWELDALEPALLVELITDKVLEYRDDDLLEEVTKQQEKERRQLAKIRDDLKKSEKS